MQTTMQDYRLANGDANLMCHMTYTTASDADGFVYFGGQHNNDHMKYYQISTQTSRIIPIIQNEARKEILQISYGMCCANEQNVFVFGGTTNNAHLKGLGIFDNSMQSWQKLQFDEPAPSPRGGHSMILRKNCLLVYAGYYNSTYLNDFWEYNLVTKVWKTWNSGMEGRSAFAFCYCPYRDTLVTHGGSGMQAQRGISEYNFATNTWDHHQLLNVTITGHSMCMITRESVIMYLPNYNSLDASFLEYNLQTRQEVKYQCSVPLPEGEMYASMRFIPRLQSVFFIGSVFHKLVLPHSDQNLDNCYSWQAKLYHEQKQAKFADIAFEFLS